MELRSTKDILNRLIAFKVNCTGRLEDSIVRKYESSNARRPDTHLVQNQDFRLIEDVNNASEASPRKGRNPTYMPDECASKTN